MSPITEIEKTHFTAFVQKLAPSKNLADRWRYFVAKNKPDYWTGVDPMKYWEVSSTEYEMVDLSKYAMQDWLEIQQISQSLEMVNEVVLVACGHAEPLVKTYDVRTFFAICPSTTPIEYVASLIPGKLALVSNHNGETKLLHR